MKKFKGIVLVVILLLASIMMPFDVYAAVQSQIVPTFSSSTSQWNGHLYVTNFSDGTNNQSSSTLSFTFDDDYYGIIYFDGYGPSNQHIANYAACFVAGGYGEYRYSYYQNGVINITSVTINIVNVVKPDSSVDLTQIIQLLTEIEADTTAIDNLMDSTLTEIRSVLSQLIISNNYLDIMTNLKQWHPYTESIPFLITLFRKGYQIIDNDINNTGFTNYMDYPIFVVPSGSIIEERTMYTTSTQNEYYIVFGTNENINNVTNFNTYFDFQIVDGNFEYNTSSIIVNSGFRIIKLSIKCTSNGTFRFKAKSSNRYIMPIVSVRKDQMNFTTDFALLFQFSNRYLDNINIIANGTTQSSQAASDLESSNDQMADDMDDLATIESGYNQQFNNQLQQIDFTSPLQNNAGILPAANFVITIFNGLINNNPFSVLIIVVCILLIGKKVIGK